MRFLISAFALLFISVGAYPQTNPFSVNLGLEKHIDADGEKQTIKVTVVSNSSNKEKYYLTLSLPAAAIRNINNKNSYTGSLEPMDSDSFFVDVEPVGEGRGQVKATIYKYVNEKNIDSANAKEHIFDYSVVKDESDKYLIYISKPAAQQTDAGGVISGVELGVDDSVGTNEGETDQATKIIVNEVNRNNNFLRYALFLLSFFVIGHLIYRIVRED